MYYFSKENSNIVKYKVTLDEEKLKGLRSEIIERCSYISHEKGLTKYPPSQNDYEHIRNLKKELKETDDWYIGDDLYYFVDFIYYEHPKLVSLIDDLLNGKTIVIEEIELLGQQNLPHQIVLEELEILNQQQEIINNLTKVEIDDRNSLINLLKKSEKKLLDFQEKKELNKNQISATAYCTNVLACITLTKQNQLKISEVLSIQDFFLLSNEDNYNKEVNKILKMSK